MNCAVQVGGFQAALLQAGELLPPEPTLISLTGGLVPWRSWLLGVLVEEAHQLGRGIRALRIGVGPLRAPS
jgi:hypothetical protein